MSYSKKTKKVYAVATGRKPGIYHEWFGPGGAEAQIKSYPGARFKGFPTLAEAREWLQEMSHGNIADRTANRQPNSKPEPPKPQQPSLLPIENAPAKSVADRVIIYTDGGCLNNPGPGGYGIVIMYKGKRKEISGGFRLTTNNRMELTACIEALKSLQTSSPVLLYSDSQYVVNGITKGWAVRWRRKSWMRAKDSPAENADLWDQLLKLSAQRDVEFSWVRGHNGNAGNERCDILAKNAAMDKSNQEIDKAYETNRTKGPAALFPTGPDGS